MEMQNASIRDVFPPHDPVARCLVSLGAASNAIYGALKRAGTAREDEDPEFHAHVLLATGHAYEACKALTAYRSTFPEVRDFFSALPADLQADLRKATSVLQKVGKSALARSRDCTFHYPHPNTGYSPSSDALLREALDQMSDEDATLHITDKVGEDGYGFRLVFADRAMFALALSAHSGDEKELEQQLRETQEAAMSIVRLAQGATIYYLRHVHHAELEVAA